MSSISAEISGNLLSESILESLAEETSRHAFAKPESFRWYKYDVVDGQSIHLSRIAEAYENLKARWDMLSSSFEEIDISDLREKWVKYLFLQLGYDLEYQKADVIADSGNKFCLSHRGWNGQYAPIIHTVLFNQDLDKKPDDGRHKYSPHDTLQRYLNQSEEDLWAIVTNGKELRILRDFHHETRQAYVEFDLELIFEGRNYNDFRLLWRLIHPSRFVTNDEGKCILETLFEESKNAGLAIGEHLQKNVRLAIESFGNGFLLSTPGLVEELMDNDQKCLNFYRQVLRVIYRVLFLFYAEQRKLMPTHSALYAQEYSLSSLRDKIESKLSIDSQHTDIWEGLKVTFKMVYEGVPELGITAFNGQLFSSDNISLLNKSQCRNDKLLETIKYMSMFEKEGLSYRISYVELSVDEFGAIYESLLEYIPRICSNGETFEDAVFGNRRNRERQIPPRNFFLDPRGTNRKTSGSYYTNPGLVNALIESALIPVLVSKLEEAGPNKDVQEKALLSLKVCDPACGSAAFLIAATEYLGEQLARIRTQNDYPSDMDIRHARRDALRHCIYGVDINPMSVELAKVSLWLTAATNDQPLNFLDHHIKCGNSLIGATPELIKKGIPPEAYSPVEGDNKELTKKRISLAKGYWKDKKLGQPSFNIEEKNAMDVSIPIEDISNVCEENTPEELKKIEETYREYRVNDKFLKDRIIADFWAAAFFWKHDNEQGEYPKPDKLVRLITDDTTELSEEIKIRVIQLAKEYGFFHWHLEFPEVFANGGFHCILGNPPFMGGLKISENYGDIYRKWLNNVHKGVKGRTDLCAFFYRISFNIIKQYGRIGMIATNTMGQGETRDGGLSKIIEQGGVITFARRFVKWVGSANVEVNLLGIMKGKWDGPVILDNQQVNYISSRLDDEREAEPKQLSANKNKAFQGSIILGEGFILNSKEASDLIRKDSRNEECIFPYIMGEDINSRMDYSPSRWVVQLDEKDEKDSQAYPDIWIIVRERVWPERKNKDKNKYPRMVNEWWKHWNNRKELYLLAHKLKSVLIRSRVSELHMLVFVSTNIIYSDATVVFIYDDYYHFGLLQSSLHEIWVRKNASTMRTDIRYTPRNCFETFPFPQDIEEVKHNCVVSTATKYYQCRDNLLKNRQTGLTAIYNLFNNQDCKESDIEQFRSLHKELDNAILGCYKWKDIQLNHNFYRNDRGQLRYTISPEARSKIINRLIQLNSSISEGSN